MENRRQIIHIGMVAFALLLAVLNRVQSLGCATIAFLFNVFVMPRIGSNTFREHERARGFSTGMLMYPVSVFVLIALFPALIAAGAWAVMSFGDGFASLVGQRMGARKLPWNPNKSWAGVAAFVIFGAAGAFGFMMYIAHFRSAPLMGNMPMARLAPWLLAAAVTAAVAGAAMESLNIKLNDNLSVPLCAGLVLYLLLFAANNPLPVFAGRALPAVGATLIVGVLSLALKAVDVWGFLGGCAIGFVIYYGAGYEGFLILLSFFVLGTLCTKIGYRIKVSRGVAQGKKGRRGLRNALANGLAGTVMAYIAACLAPDAARTVSLLPASAATELVRVMHPAFTAAFVASFAAATMDTVSSELGQVLGRRPVLITTMKPVPHGTNGGVTLTGTLLGLTGAVAVAALACALGLLPWGMFWLPVAAAAIGSTIDSLLGATLENSGAIDNEFVNLSCTAGAALFALAVYVAVTTPNLKSLLLLPW